MKKLLVVSFLALGITQAASVFIPMLKTKQEFPEIILDGPRSHYFSNKIENFCPRDLSISTVEYSVDEDAVEIYKHCNKCLTGVYTHHKGKDERTCTFCDSKEF